MVLFVVSVSVINIKAELYKDWWHDVSRQTYIQCIFIDLSQGGHILAEMKFPVFSLCYINFPCVIFTQKITISSMNKGHITTVLLHTEAYKLISKVWIIWSVSIVNFSKCLLIEGSRESCEYCNDQGFRTLRIWYVKIILCWAHFTDIFKMFFF